MGDYLFRPAVGSRGRSSPPMSAPPVPTPAARAAFLYTFWTLFPVFLTSPSALWGSSPSALCSLFLLCYQTAW